MSVVLYRLAGVGLACALVAPASAQLLSRKDLSAATALAIAQTAIATCTANGYRVSATIVGRNGEVIVQVRGDGTGPHTMENSFKKAFTARNGFGRSGFPFTSNNSIGPVERNPSTPSRKAESVIRVSGTPTPRPEHRIQTPFRSRGASRPYRGFSTGPAAPP